MTTTSSQVLLNQYYSNTNEYIQIEFHVNIKIFKISGVDQGPVAWVWTCDDGDCDDMCFPTCSTQSVLLKFNTSVFLKLFQVQILLYPCAIAIYCTLPGPGDFQSEALLTQPYSQELSSFIISWYEPKWTPTTTIMYYRIMWHLIAGY